MTPSSLGERGGRRERGAHLLLTALPLGLVLDRTAPSDRVVRAALIAGVAAMVADRFV